MEVIKHIPLDSPQADILCEAIEATNLDAVHYLDKDKNRVVAISLPIRKVNSELNGLSPDNPAYEDVNTMIGIACGKRK